MIYSFDIFDTLLLRPYADPQEVWRVLEEQEGEIGFARARKEADKITFQRATKKGEETTVEAAYELIPQFRHLMKREMELERKVLRANSEMLKLWNKLGTQGERRVIVSDMYLPAEFIKSVLREKGFDGWDGFYLSRDYKVRKSSGKLFEVMLKSENVRPEDVLHIGDNIQSDVQIPQKLGIQTKHYVKVIDRLYKQFPFTENVDGRLSGLLALGLHEFKLKCPDNTYWHRLGFMMAGVLGYIYVKWIVETAKQLGKNHLMFVARDGYIWQRICNAIYPEIKTDYFYAPRLTSIAVLGAIGSDAWAIKDRKDYILKHLNDVDLKQVESCYKDYLGQFLIDKDTAVVDGCSSGFSAQRLVEKEIGTNMFSFYLLSMAKKHCAASLYSTNLYALQFHEFSEFLFGSPEPPIIGVSSNGPIYSDNYSNFEQFKIEHSSEICKGAESCALVLFQNNVEISPEKWINYVDGFMTHLTSEDCEMLGKAKNATDVEQKHFHPVIYRPYHKIDFFLKKGNRLSFSLNFVCFKNLLSIIFNRKGISWRHRNMKVRVNDIGFVSSSRDMEQVVVLPQQSN